MQKEEEDDEAEEKKESSPNQEGREVWRGCDWEELDGMMKVCCMKLLRNYKETLLYHKNKHCFS